MVFGCLSSFFLFIAFFLLLLPLSGLNRRPEVTIVFVKGLEVLFGFKRNLLHENCPPKVVRNFSEDRELSM